MTPSPREPAEKPKPDTRTTIESKSVMTADGRWTRADHYLTRGPSGLSDRPVNGAEK